MVTDVGENGFNEGSGSLQLVEHEAPAVLSSKPMEQNPPSFEGGSSAAVSLRLSNLVVGQRQHTEGSPLPRSPHPGGLDHGCVKLGLGRSHRRSTGLGHMGNCSEIGTHKYAGVTSGVPFSSSLSIDSEQQDSAGTVRQHDGGGVHQSSGGNQVHLPVSTGLGPVPLVGSKQYLSESGLSAGGSERPGGRLVQGQGLSHGVGLAQGRGPTNLPDLGKTPCGLVCLGQERSAPHLLHKVSAATGVGNGCSSTRLDRNVCLRLPSDLAPVQSVIQSGTGAVQDHPDSPILASTTLVSTTGVTPGCPPSSPPDQGRPAVSARGSPLSSTREPALDCVDVVKSSLRAAGLSEEAASLAAASRRDSTVKVYNSRIRHWAKWCKRRGCDPCSAPLGEVAEFLTHLHGDGLCSNTIAGYRSAIGAIHTGFSDGSSLSNNPILHRLIVGAFTLRPPQSKLVPAWSLTLDDQALSRAPYEPLLDSSLKNLSLKCSFLLSLASARRVSQLTALSVDKDHLVWTQDGVVLSTRVGFLAKSQRLHFNPEPISLKAISVFSSKAEDLLCCPVRALRAYVNRTKSIRGKCSQLFIKIIAPHNGIRPPTLASWIVETIRSAYPEGVTPDSEEQAKSSSGVPHAHDVHGVSASWAKSLWSLSCERLHGNLRPPSRPLMSRTFH